MKKSWKEKGRFISRFGSFEEVGMFQESVCAGIEELALCVL